MMFHYITESLYRVTQICVLVLEFTYKKLLLTPRLRLRLSFYSFAIDPTTTLLVEDTFIGQGFKYSPVNLKFCLLYTSRCV